MFPNILAGLPFYAMYQYSPTLPKFYYGIKSQEQRVAYLCCEYDKLIKYMNTITDAENETREAVNKLTELFQQFQQSGFDDYYAVQIEQWVHDNMERIISSTMKMVFFGLTDDGYFCAYIPDSWSDIVFDTGASYADQTTYGRLILSY
jgi:hypothetical protein